MARLIFDPIFNSWFAVAFVAVVLLAAHFFLWLPRLADGDSRGCRRLWFIMLRICAEAVLIIAITRPMLEVPLSSPTDAVLPILIDSSKSMVLSDKKDRSRWEEQNTLVKAIYDQLSRLAVGLKLKFYFYDSVVEEIQDPSSIGSNGVGPIGNLTDISRAIKEPIDRFSSRSILGIVLLGDGVHNPYSGDSGNLAQSETTQSAGSTEDPSDVAKRLGTLGVPLWVIPIGEPEGRNVSEDVAIHYTPELFTVYSGTEFEFEFTVKAKSLEGREIPLTVWLQKLDHPGGQRVELASRVIVPASPNESMSISIPLVLSEIGDYQLKVEVSPQDGESVTSNNSQISFVKVLSGGGRIQYLGNGPDLECTYISRSLRQQSGVSFDRINISGGSDSVRLTNPELKLGTEGLDAIVLGNLEAADLDCVDWESIEQAVKSGVGLLVTGDGSAIFSGNTTNPLITDILPVSWLGEPVFQEGGASNHKFFIRRADHPITSIGSTNGLRSDQKDFWELLVPLNRFGGFLAAKKAPGVRVLLETSESRPILVIGQYGKGRVAVFTEGSTWKWWRSGAELVHQRFWRQLLLWVSMRREVTDRVANIELERRRFNLGDTIDWKVTAPAGANPAIIEVKNLDSGVVASLEGNRVLNSGSDLACTTGHFIALTPGVFRLTVRDEIGDNICSEFFLVGTTESELEAANPGHPLMRRLADETSTCGGEIYMPSQIANLIKKIVQLHKDSELNEKKIYSVANFPSVSWLILLIFVFAVTTEWFFRRRLGLA
jgi:hypothetical protein